MDLFEGLQSLLPSPLRPEFGVFYVFCPFHVPWLNDPRMAQASIMNETPQCLQGVLAVFGVSRWMCMFISSCSARSVPVPASYRMYREIVRPILMYALHIFHHLFERRSVCCHLNPAHDWKYATLNRVFLGDLLSFALLSSVELLPYTTSSFDVAGPSPGAPVFRLLVLRLLG